MKKKPSRIFYLHGFNSSPASAKARMFVDYCHQRDIDVTVPSLPYDPARAMTLLEGLIDSTKTEKVLLVGSSLGGYYATWLAQRYNLPVALVNPAVAPFEDMGKKFLGWQKNIYTAEEYEFTQTHLDYLRTLSIKKINNPANFLLLVQTGDKVLDYRLAVVLYAGCTQVVQTGGSHSFDNCASVFPIIMRFAGLE